MGCALPPLHTPHSPPAGCRTNPWPAAVNQKAGSKRECLLPALLWPGRHRAAGTQFIAAPSHSRILFLKGEKHAASPHAVLR